MGTIVYLVGPQHTTVYGLQNGPCNVQLPTSSEVGMQNATRVRQPQGAGRQRRIKFAIRRLPTLLAARECSDFINHDFACGYSEVLLCIEKKGKRLKAEEVKPLQAK